jgi:prolyl 4-hydroxylase
MLLTRVLTLTVLALFMGASQALFWSTQAEIDDDYDANTDPNDYGVDTSFPMHHFNGGKQLKSKNPMKAYFAQRYADHIQGCYDKYSFRECDANERARIEMALTQPAHQHNYTQAGFMKRRLHEDIMSMITNYWEAHKTEEKAEQWPRGNTYTNNWLAPTYMVNFEQTSPGRNVKAQLWARVKPIIEEWTGQKLTESSLYGIRVYKNNSILATHVDRLPLVSSCIIQVAQDVDEPWPVEVIGHDGKAHNITMIPGDMVLYESHSILHGRPFPLKGRFYANIFVHYIPISHDENNKKDTMHEPSDTALKSKKMTKSSIGGHEGGNHDLETIARHRSEHDLANRGGLRGQQKEEPPEEPLELLDGQTALHIAAQNGDLDEARKLLEGSGPTLLHARDANQWQAVHEAARAGNVDLMRFLVERGADVTARTVNGGSVLYWAKQSDSKGKNDIIAYLESIDAPYYSESSEEISL